MIDLSLKVMEYLQNSQFWTPHTRISDNSIQNLVCPVCGDTSAWAYSPANGNGPLSINCNKLSSCGARTKTMELFNIHVDIEKEYRPTPKDKHRPARVYLESRGLKKSLEGLEFEYWPKVRKTKSGAVMFPVQSPDGSKVYNGRLINPSREDGKTHNSGSTTGCFWLHNGIEYDTKKNTFIVESIIDALSLVESGQQCIAILAAGQDPGKLKLPPLGKLVIAPDPDNAGVRMLRKWKSAYPESDAIMPDKGDWNDILRSAEPEQVKTIFDNDYDRYQTNAKLALAKSAQEYATTYNGFHNRAPGIFIHNDSTYYSYRKKKGDDSQLIVERIGRFRVEVLSILRNNSNPDQPEYSFHLKITPKGKQPIETLAVSKDLATVRGLKEFFISRSSIAFEAGSQSANAFTSYVTSSKAPEVTQMSQTGFDLVTQWYVFKYFAVDERGKVHVPDARGLYKVNHRSWLRAAVHAGDKAIKPADKGKSVHHIHHLITQAWGDNGAAAFAFLISSWFVNQIKEELNFFFFSSFWGQPSSGKSALTYILQILQGCDTEGLPITSLNSKKGLARSISRVSGMMTSLLEDNRRDEKNFDYGVILSGFNKGPLQVQAVYSGDNRTSEAPFLGTLAFIQNIEPFNSQAEKERVVSLRFDTDDLTEASSVAYEKLAKIPNSVLARTIIQVLEKRVELEKGWFKEYEKACIDLATVQQRRILQNHALLLGWHRLICKTFKIKYDLTSFVLETAKKKVISSTEREYNQADRFFEALTHLDEEKVISCIHLDTEKGLLYVNLPGVEEKLRNAGIQIYANDSLTQALTKHPSFVKNSHNFRFPNDQQLGADNRAKVRRVWVFNQAKI